MIRFGHLLAVAELDSDFKAELKATAAAVMKRFRNEIETSMTTVIAAEKRSLIVYDPFARKDN